MPRTPREHLERDPRDPRDPDAQRHQRRKGHRYNDSASELLPQSPRHHRRRDSESQSPRKERPRKKKYHYTEDERTESSNSASRGLSADALGQLDALNVGDATWNSNGGVKRTERYESIEDEARRRERRERRERRRREREGGEHRYRERGQQPRVVSGTYLERGAEPYDEKVVLVDRRVRMRGGAGSAESEGNEARRRKRRKIGIVGIIIIVILAIVIPVGVVLSNKKKSSSPADTASDTSSSAGSPSNKNLDGMKESDIPTEAQGTILDPFTWYDTSDFNVTYTAATVGGLSLMGLNETWDDSAKANDNVPALDKSWEYGKMPIRGVNVGGWLSIEPVITPSLFSDFKTSDRVIDEWTLCSKLGASRAQTTLEKHYATFITEQDFAGIQAAGFDHVRIPFSYWAVTTYEGDPYVSKISWRYLLRAIEWARKYGLRINLDLHGAPGSQNGWNHSGHQGAINWLNGTDGTLNGQRTLDTHSQLSIFFSQSRYKNIITIYGLVNEPKMTYLDVDTVLTWTKSAIQKIRANNMTAIITFGDGFRGLDNWQGELQDYDNLLLDVHQYVIFNNQQIALDHSKKVDFACSGWTNQTLRSSDTATGFGPTLCGEWSQADTDCATYLNNVGVGSRWEGTLNMISTPGGSLDGSVLSPTCPTANSPRCSCTNANASPSSYSDGYKQWLRDFAEAQMYSFEKGWGWFYWTWKTESATQWSYKDGLAAGILPSKTWERTFTCGSVPDYAGMGLAENY
ncbi:glycoside hydrolase family 5 protein [Aureobasidium subglaciale EXF-2481]|uniref:glucan 1,3-beta-glucosidase n=1 Tax=Aureobasidium subglaciale (strain EXF-2481) TaxID=1043005 RepID=A0A074Z5A5_AURSE|nr:glycoside hydrolase family 5 protein [Aureobasidium subglaciale EXF-2481]KEQ94106.1 glycoside hydrolase family 5 protein [Aureobasidium subglaciale EXF-2481]